MNITLSADEGLVRAARNYAHEHGTSLNQMVRDYLAQLVGGTTPQDAAEAFRRVATEQPGRSPDGWRFDRNAIHRHEGDGS